MWEIKAKNYVSFREVPLTQRDSFASLPTPTTLGSNNSFHCRHINLPALTSHIQNWFLTQSHQNC